MTQSREENNKKVRIARRNAKRNLAEVKEERIRQEIRLKLDEQQRHAANKTKHGKEKPKKHIFDVQYKKNQKPTFNKH